MSLTDDIQISFSCVDQEVCRVGMRFRLGADVLAKSTQSWSVRLIWAQQP